MRQRCAFVMLLAATMMFSASAFGQRPGQGRRGPGDPGRPGGMGGSIVGLLMNGSVREELGISQEQGTKLRELARAGIGQRMNREEFQNLSREERVKKMQEMRQAMSRNAQELEKKLATVLDEKQMNRLHQIQVQAMGMMALRNPQIQEKLGITDEQKEKLAAAQREIFAKMREQFSSGQRPSGEDRAKLQQQIKDAALAVFTDDQKAKWKEMVGEPFDVSQIRQMGAAGGRRPGQGRPGQGRPGGKGRPGQGRPGGGNG